MRDRLLSGTITRRGFLARAATVAAGAFTYVAFGSSRAWAPTCIAGVNCWHTWDFDNCVKKVSYDTCRQRSPRCVKWGPPSTAGCESTATCSCGAYYARCHCYSSPHCCCQPRICVSCDGRCSCDFGQQGCSYCA